MSEQEDRKRAAAESKAELAFSQALWYAWGRIDSGRYFGVDPFKFAERVKAATLSFELEETYYLESIQGAWDKFVKGE